MTHAHSYSVTLVLYSTAHSMGRQAARTRVRNLFSIGRADGITGVARHARLAHVPMRKPLSPEKPLFLPYAATLTNACLLLIKCCNHPLDFPVMVFCNQLSGVSGLLNHPLFLTGVDSIMEFEFRDYGGGVAIVYEGYFVCWLDG